MNHTVLFLLLLTMPLVSRGADDLPADDPPRKRRPLPGYHTGLAPILQVSTAGFGAGIAHSVSRHVAVRAGINFFNYQGIYNAGKDTDDLQLAFDYSFKLTSFNLLLDYYPFRRLGFRLTAGTYYNRNRFSLFGQSTKDFKFNDVVFTVKDIGTIEGTARFSTIRAICRHWLGTSVPAQTPQTDGRSGNVLPELPQNRLPYNGYARSFK